MTTLCEVNQRFRNRLLGSELLIGTFIKTPTPHPIEILGGLGFDFVVIDQEHGVFDRQTTDHAILAGLATEVACLVRVPSSQPHDLLTALDQGAAGVVVPHVTTAQAATAVARACRYAEGTRGFSGVTRAGSYGGRTMKGHIAASDASVTVVAQIEDREALENIDAIVAARELDAVFVGAGDLALSMGADSPRAAIVQSAIRTICRAAFAASKPVVGFAGSIEEARNAGDLGMSGLVVGSDHNFLAQAAKSTIDGFRAYSATLRSS